MFSSLLLADLVIADITIHNANVFYELGIRHALRNQKTILIKCPGCDETPFDILGYKYVTYERDEPEKALQSLVRTIRETLDADRKDSPVFNVLPQLKMHDLEASTIYQRLGEEVMKADADAGKNYFTRSDQAIAAIVANKSIS